MRLLSVEFQELYVFVCSDIHRVSLQITYISVNLSWNVKDDLTCMTQNKDPWGMLLKE